MIVYKDTKPIRKQKYIASKHISSRKRFETITMRASQNKRPLDASRTSLKNSSQALRPSAPGNLSKRGYHSSLSQTDRESYQIKKNFD